ncbi:MAG: hypothetical protein DWH78_05655 [Planctomycetota bacterium]|jgi:TRAP-type uncharacterized transport system fused permease subunit|nr:MAG: hypothetical protein DWH78_05655 [Planctomycetota bacterium]
MAADRELELPLSTEVSEPANIVAWAGIVFGFIAALLYGVLFFLLSELPDNRQELEGLTTNSPALTQLLIAGGSAGLLNLVSLILCLTGYLIPGRSKFEAIVGTLLSALMLLAVFSVVFVSLMLTP